MEFSFASFVEGITSNPVLLITVLLTLGVIFANKSTEQ